MARVRGRNASLAHTPLAYVDTYGCQQNEADSEKLRGMLIEMGYSINSGAPGSDVIVVNTCAVRDHAEKRALGNIGALKHVKAARPGCVLAVCGCMPQRGAMADKLRASYSYVDLVFGVHALWRFPELLERALARRGRVFDAGGGDGAVAEGLPSARGGGVKAWLPIMYGCDNYCSYCVVPYVRGRERSREPGAVLAEARAIVGAGYKDITLLGQNVNSYGRALAPDTDFPELLRLVNGIDGDFIIRFMTSHPKDAGERLFRAMAQCEKVARHIHLPFQAGSGRVLKAMNRGYTKHDYLGLIDMARGYMPDIVITSDVIVGFPGETREDFNETVDVIKAVRFDALFTFIYSPREGTPAASMDDSVPRSEKQVWFDELLSVQNAISSERHSALVGAELRVLVDGRDGDGSQILTGRTNGGRLVRISGAQDGDIGRFVRVKITSGATWSLSGEKRSDQQSCRI
jgi:tRNA-2-methylthio-N6-dimethylallyladenosine synthase